MFLVSALLARAPDCKLGGCAALGSTDRSWCPRRKEQERQNKQSELRAELRTVSSQFVWQTPHIKPFISSFFFFFLTFSPTCYCFLCFFSFHIFHTSKRGGQAHQGRDGE